MESLKILVKKMSIESIKKLYLQLYGYEGVGIFAINEIENLLGIRLPEEMKAVSKFYSGGQIGDFSHHSFERSSGATNIVDETIRLRNSIGLPNKYMVLAEPPESIICLDVNTGCVIWCDASDINGLSDGKFHNKPTTWEGYLAFFQSMLESESSGNPGT